MEDIAKAVLEEKEVVWKNNFQRLMKFGQRNYVGRKLN